MIRKTKIICTIGPTCYEIETIKAMLKAGMNVARFNFSHDNHESHKQRIEIVREASRSLNIPVAILIDTKGPEIRTGKTKEGKVKLKEDDSVIITTEEIECTKEKISITYKGLPSDVSKGNHILIADGTIDLEVIEVIGEDIECKVIVGGEFGDKKNVNVPGVKTKLPAITQKDKDDIQFAIDNNADFIAASFIRKPEDVMEIRSILDDQKSDIHIISKIECEEAVENIDEIINHSDGIMVARGDLGVQMQPSEIPIIQKRIISKCNIVHKPVVTATQMLDSMIHNPRPTRAESSDVANAILDGTDAVMLSGETANGKYPVESVEMMKMIALKTENSPEYRLAMEHKFDLLRKNVTIEDSLCFSATDIAHSINATAIITPTLSGNTARLLSHYRLPQPIIAVTAKEKTYRQLQIVADVIPLHAKFAENTTEMLNSCIKVTLDAKLIKNLDKVVIVAGVPINSRNAINLIKVILIANTIAKGRGIIGNRACGKIVKVDDYYDALSKIKGNKEEILLIRYLDSKIEKLLDSVKGVVVQEVSLLSIEKLKNINPDIVVISEVKDAMQRLENDLTVTLDATQGFIYEGEIEREDDGENE